MQTQKSKLKSQNYSSKLKTFKFLVVILSFAFCVLSLSVNTIVALESSPSSTVEFKLEELKKEIASKSATIAEQLKSTVDKKLSNKIFYGTIEIIEKDHIRILNPNSQVKIIKTNQDTFTDKKLKNSEFIVGLGDIDDTKSLVAKKVVKSKKPEDINYLWGKILSIEKETTKVKNASGEIVSVTLPNKQSLKIKDTVILTGDFKDGVFEADFMYIDKNL